MTQFIAIERPPVGIPLEGVFLRPTAAGETLFRAATARYFRDPSRSHMVVDAQGRCESLLDEIWESGDGQIKAGATRLVRNIEVLLESNIGLLLWCGSDFHELPVCRRFEDVLIELQRQTSEQPADVWLACLPGGLDA